MVLDGAGMNYFLNQNQIKHCITSTRQQISVWMNLYCLYMCPPCLQRRCISKDTNKNIFEIEKNICRNWRQSADGFFPNKKRGKTPPFSECHHLCGSLATGDHVHQRLEEGACVAWFLLVTWFIFDANIFGIYLSTYPSIYLLVCLCITYHHYPHIAFHDRKRLGNFLPHVHMRTPKLWTFPVLRIKLPLQKDLSAQDFEVEK